MKGEIFGERSALLRFVGLSAAVIGSAAAFFSGIGDFRIGLRRIAGGTLGAGFAAAAGGFGFAVISGGVGALLPGGLFLRVGGFFSSAGAAGLFRWFLDGL